ncbi:MAG: hypothetical protein ABSG59_19345 [Verrucomicrobiota bacterium]|jgi:hypothetical protein
MQIQKPSKTPAIAAICDYLLPLAGASMNIETSRKPCVQPGAQPPPLTSSPTFNNSRYFQLFQLYFAMIGTCPITPNSLRQGHIQPE